MERYNCTVSDTTEDMTVEFNLTDKTLNLSKTLGIESIANENTEAVYCNIQCIRIANPAEGNLYREKDTKVSKVVFQSFQAYHLSEADSLKVVRLLILMPED